MNQLLKEFVTFIIQEGVFNNNLKKMAALAKDLGAMKYKNLQDPGGTLWCDFFLNPSSDKRMAREISRSEALRKHKVVKLLGSGAEGIAFLLDNGHVLKLGNLHQGQRNSNGSIRVPRKYDAKLNKRHTANDVTLHDVGRAHVEMEELMPYERWIYTQPKGIRFHYITIFNDLRILYDKLRHKGMNVEEIKNKMLSFCSDDGTRFCDRIAIAFINELDNPSQDLNSGNLGVRGDVNNPTFVFFDF